MEYDYESLSSSVSISDAIKYLRDNTKWYAILSCVGIILSVLIILLPFVWMISISFAEANYYVSAVLFFVLCALIVGGCVYFGVSQYIRIMSAVRIGRFARENNFSYQAVVDEPTGYKGVIFEVGFGRRIENQLKMNGSKRFEIANYHYETGSGRRSQIYNYGYVMIELNRNVPHIVLDSCDNNTNIFGMSVSNLPVGFKNDQKLSLEGDFNKHFTMYAPKEYERDALYIFTPDLMELFVDKTNSFDAEIIDNKLFIYCKTAFNLSDVNQLKRIFNIISTVGTKALSRTSNYSDERYDVGAGSVIVDSGKRLKRTMTALQIITLVLSILFILYYIFEVLVDFHVI